jgi:hypothetical protein
MPRAGAGFKQQDALLKAELRRQRRCAADTALRPVNP